MLIYFRQWASSVKFYWGEGEGHGTRKVVGAKNMLFFLLK